MGRFGGGRGGGPGGRGKKGGGRGGANGGRGGGGGVDKDAQFSPFLFPTPRQLHPVPLEFQSVEHFAMLIGNNLLAEFWHLIQEGPRGPAIKAMPASDGKLNLVRKKKNLFGKSIKRPRLGTNFSLHVIFAM
jgi:hypothetical protein